MTSPIPMFTELNLMAPPQIGSPAPPPFNLTQGDTASMNAPAWNQIPLDTSEDCFNLSNAMNNTLGMVTTPQMPVFSNEHVLSITAYSILFLIAGTGNLTVFLTLFRNRHKPSKVNLFIMNLCIADLIVTFIMMPLEIGWSITVAWKAGDIACRTLMFFRAFGFYLSSFILIAISLDRYFAISRPLSLADGERRGKFMLTGAWIFSVVASAPQSVIFHTEQHPFFKNFTQCVTFHFFPTPMHELAYNLFNITAVYILPLIVIIVSYSLILCEISQKSRQSYGLCNGGSSVTTLRTSCRDRIERAKSRTLKMTLVIVSVFIVCWTPYFVISAWWWFHHESAKHIDPMIQKGLFIFAVSNSCVNPIVYGMFATVFRRAAKQKWERAFLLLRTRNSGRNESAL